MRGKLLGALMTSEPGHCEDCAKDSRVCDTVKTMRRTVKCACVLQSQSPVASVGLH